MAVSGPPAGDTPLRHGYTLNSIHELTRTAVRCKQFYRARDRHERIDIAWSAIAEHLYASKRRLLRAMARARDTHAPVGARPAQDLPTPPRADQRLAFAEQERDAAVSNGLQETGTANALTA